ncbi:arylmalonate decarboxylase [Roseivivax halodurans JCM 10272]|uniref:Arylmalonate decarboxylase n=1 Tax=Roseivivax halodurans JCM 10272 TaxID=1449350 RepID=X7EKJ7_9RHOB|nr:aspartate/glutamate racemase family protein [Roseivivax halodurans]ETX16412.1 arylmalonate decarboxylase [Roseivivax halodurans JCM 10272]
MAHDPLRRFGLIALATDLTIEGDAARLMPQGTQLHVTRIAFENPTTPESLKRTGPRLKQAADLIVPGVPLDGMIFGCTSAAAALGDTVETEIGGRAPVVTPMGGLLRALETLGLSRIALLTPYLPETAELVANYLTDHGVEIVSRHAMGYADDRDMARLMPGEIIEGVLAADHPDAEALFLSCTALPAVPLIAELEARLGKPVLSSNQVVFWATLDIARIPGDRPGPGRLFTICKW